MTTTPITAETMTLTMSPAQPMTLSLTIVRLLSALFGPSPDGALHVLLRSVSGIDQSPRFVLRPVDLDPQFVPIALLKALEEGCWSMFVTAAVTRSALSREPARLHVLPLTWIIPREYRKRLGVVAPAELITAALDRIKACPIRPAFILQGGTPVHGAGTSIVAIYLSVPIDVRALEGQAAALHVLTRFSAALEAEPPPEDLRDLVVPIPGSLVREGGASVDVVRALEVSDPTTIHTLADIEHAITPTTSSKTAPARRRQEAS